MKRSQINKAFKDASSCFAQTCWALPPNAAWDITDFGMGKFDTLGITLVNLAEESEYCEKIIYIRKGQMVPNHAHKVKKEDIICRNGILALRLWKGHPDHDPEESFEIKVNREWRSFRSGDVLTLEAGERVTLEPLVYHMFWCESDECVIGEVSTANDDANDNFFVDTELGRFSSIEEDEPALLRLLNE
ncbi:D-lyxose/D-mannose family sugar isomerase [Pelagicoccus mobilis]|uniref:D-lyxose ketol-isomerase n=1 Tax=Pelagicoccus mobilis TaxID=415221 RepID=A0A934VTM3_9BACT|nr:D-lyxose/D-mannose family sugar isomerase [Pelagicoccus mobilis]MBK1880220.1 D-lyxose/D-mannose family sugar isomerase [Pelagicoccus mobilis]